MTQYAVIFAPQAREQLASLYRYIAAAASPEIAERYTSAIVTYCESLQTFPMRGTRRDEIRPGLRITNYRKRAVFQHRLPDQTVPAPPQFVNAENVEHGLAGPSDNRTM